MKHISFTQKVKNELISLQITNSHAKAYEFCGMILFCKKFSINSIDIQNDNKQILLLYEQLITQEIKINLYHKETKRVNKTFYEISSMNINNNKKIIHYVANYLHKKNDFEKYLSNFIKGIFIACGVILDPQKGYYLEFSIDNRNLFKYLELVLGYIKISYKSKIRGSSNILYIKKSRIIEDLLTYIGATKSSLEIMNIEIYKNLRNKVNRLINCETHNINKVISSSYDQIKSIQKIKQKKGLGWLPRDLREIAIIREKYPDLSLSELVYKIPSPISKSGLYYKLKKIKKLTFSLEKDKTF